MKQEIEKAVKGLVYISETDAPLNVVKIREISHEQFFSNLTIAEEANGVRVLNLKHLLEKLSDLRVFHIGEVEVDVLIIGKDSNGELVAIKTKAVET